MWGWAWALGLWVLVFLLLWLGFEVIRAPYMNENGQRTDAQGRVLDKAGDADAED